LIAFEKMASKLVWVRRSTFKTSES